MGFCFLKFLILHSYGLPVQTIVRHFYYSVTHFHPSVVGLGFPSPKKFLRTFGDHLEQEIGVSLTGMTQKMQYMFVKLNSLQISLKPNPGFSVNIKVCFSTINHSYGHLKCVYKVIHNCLSVVYMQLITTVSQQLSALDPWW